MLKRSEKINLLFTVLSFDKIFYKKKENEEKTKRN